MARFSSSKSFCSIRLISPGTLCMNSVTVPTPLSTSAAAAHSSSASVSSTHSAAAAPRRQPCRES